MCSSDLFRHEPEGVPGRYTWAGHVHPMVTLASGSDALRLPCFHVGANLGILPAFGTFTAGVSLRRQPGDEVFAVAEGQVVAIRGGGRRGACA